MSRFTGVSGYEVDERCQSPERTSFSTVITDPEGKCPCISWSPCPVEVPASPDTTSGTNTAPSWEIHSRSDASYECVPWDRGPDGCPLFEVRPTCGLRPSPCGWGGLDGSRLYWARVVRTGYAASVLTSCDTFVSSLVEYPLLSNRRSCTIETTAPGSSTTMR